MQFIQKTEVFWDREKYTKTGKTGVTLYLFFFFILY